MAPKVIRKLPTLGGFPYGFLREMVLGNDVIVDVELEVPRRGLAVDQAVGLDGRFLGVALALNRDPALEAPLGGPAIGTERPRVAVEHIGVNPLEKFVGFKLALDLRQERLGYRLHHAENGDRNFGIAEHLPNGARESDDGRFVVEPRPQIDIAVRVALYLAAAVEQPRVFCVLAPEQDGQKEIAIVAAEQRKVAGRR